MCYVDGGRRRLFGSEERREQMRKREKLTEIMREERENFGGNEIKILLLFLEYCYSAILKIELHCSKYCKKFTIVAFSIPRCNMF